MNRLFANKGLHIQGNALDVMVFLPLAALEAIMGARPRPPTFFIPVAHILPDAGQRGP
jgi:hypothetical protein